MTALVLPVRPARAAEAEDAVARERRLARRWRIGVVAAALVASVAATTLVHLLGFANRWGDEASHLLSGRRVFDSLTPGFGQLGNYFPPLHAFVELPLVWNDWLYRTGLAGVIPSMAFFVVGTYGAYRLGEELTGRRGAGALAAAVYGLNPNMLYLQSASMLESGIGMTLVWSAVALLRVGRSGRFRDVVVAGAWSGLAVWSTWAALALPVYGAMVVWRGCRRRGYERRQSEAFSLGYLLLAGYPALLWLVWNFYIQHQPLYMLNYKQPVAQVVSDHTFGGVQTQHNLALSALNYGASVLDLFGPVVTAAVLAVALTALLRRRFVHPLAVTALGGVLVLATLYGGQVSAVGSRTFAWLTGYTSEDARFMNIRYALWLAPFAAASVAVLAARLRTRLPALVALVAVGCVWFVPALRGVAAVQPTEQLLVSRQAAHALAASYRSGTVLTSSINGGDLIIWLSHLPAHSFLTETNGSLFLRALRTPRRSASYVLLGTGFTVNARLGTDLARYGFVRLWTVSRVTRSYSLWRREGAP